MEIKLRPWVTPNFVRLEAPPVLRQEGWRELDGIPLKDVPAEDLDRLCTEFRAEVFRKAGKKDPRPEVPHA